MGWVLPPRIDWTGKDLGCSESFLSDLIDTLSLSTLKDADEKRYIEVNSKWAEYLGIESANELIGLKVDDLNSIVAKFDCSPAFRCDNSAHLEQTKTFDNQLLEIGGKINFQEIIFTPECFIHIKETTKLPIFGHIRNKIIAILTYYNDITNHTDLSTLFSLYRKYYQEKQAIQLLLRYLKIYGYFLQLPTVRELEVLFAMYSHAHRKHLSRCLNISYNTVASHVQHIKDKLIKPDFNEVLTQLRKVSAGVDERYT